MNVATPCGLCGDPLEGTSFHDAACEQPVCTECSKNLYVARVNLEQQGMQHIFTGPCPDNGPEGLKKP